MKQQLKIGILLGIMCMLLTAGIAIQIKTVNNSSTTVGKTQTENELRDSVLKWKEKYEELYEEELEKEEELANLRNEASNQDTSSVILSEELQEAEILLGQQDVVGEGIIITLNDANTASTLATASELVVHDADLLEVVNELKVAGAEAISINGQRIVNTTAITCAGSVIQVNGEKIAAPYEIRAIGLKDRLYGALTMIYGYLYWAEYDGLQVKVEKSDSVSIPKYDGVYHFQYAENVG